MSFPNSAASQHIARIMNTFFNNPVSDKKLFGFLNWLTKQGKMACEFRGTSDPDQRAKFDELGFAAGEDYSWIIEEDSPDRPADMATFAAGLVAPFVLTVRVGDGPYEPRADELGLFQFNIESWYKTYEKDAVRERIYQRQLLREKVSQFVDGQVYTPEPGDIVVLREEYKNGAFPAILETDLFVITVDSNWLLARTAGNVDVAENITVAFLDDAQNLRTARINSSMVQLVTAADPNGFMAEWANDEARNARINIGGRSPVSQIGLNPL